MQMQRTYSLLLIGTALITAACADKSGVITGIARQDRAVVNPTVQSDDESLALRNDVQIVSATGDIAGAVSEYRGLLGSLNPNVAGEQPGGRREINWDGVPAAVTNTDAFPANFFNVNSPRGVVFTTDGTGFRVSDNGYTDVNPAFAGEFNFFSPKKLFTALGSTVTEVRFFVAGSNTPATVTGFGSVFADVGREYSTTIEYFDAAGERLLRVKAPRRSDANGLSFVGAVFNSRVVARVRITSGDTPIGADAEDNVKGAGQKRDIVVMDDFIYGEPRAIN